MSASRKQDFHHISFDFVFTVSGKLDQREQSRISVVDK